MATAKREPTKTQGYSTSISRLFLARVSHCFRINRGAGLTSGDSMDTRYERTLAISEKISSNNYELIEKWECVFDTELSQNDQLQRFVRENVDNLKRKPLDDRDADRWTYW